MINWSFNQQEYDPNDDGSFKVPAPGIYTVRFKNVEEKYSKNGTPMYELTLEIPGYTGTVRDYMTFSETNPQFTNQRLGSIFDSFGITMGDLNPQHWIGHVGQANITNEDYNGKTYTRVKNYIPKAKQQPHPNIPSMPQPQNFASMREDPSFNEFLNEPTGNGQDNGTFHF